LTRWFHSRLKQEIETNRFKVHLLHEDSIRRLYCHCLDQYVDKGAMSEINMEWQHFKAIIIKTATEVLGRRYKRIRKKGLIFLNGYIASHINDKKKEFLKF